MRTLLSFLIAASITAPPLNAQTSAPQAQSPANTATSNNQSNGIEILKDPFKLTVGYADGGVSTIIKGSKEYIPRSLWDPAAENFNSNRALFADIALDGNWKSNSDANQLSVSVRPGVYIWGANGFTDTLSYFTVYADGREKYGQSKDSAGQPANINQTIAGAGADWAPRPFGHLVKLIAGTFGDNDTTNDPFGDKKVTGRLDATPYFSLRYYRVFDSSTTLQAVPDDIKADKFVAGFNSDLSIPYAHVLGQRFRFLLEASETRPTSGAKKKWQHYVDAGIALDNASGGGKWVLRYVTGEKEGFKYDRQLIIGLLWRWVQGRTTNQSGSSAH